MEARAAEGRVTARRQALEMGKKAAGAAREARERRIRALHSGEEGARVEAMIERAQAMRQYTEGVRPMDEYMGKTAEAEERLKGRAPPPKRRRRRTRRRKSKKRG